MASNVYTKNEILQNLASRGYFIDAYTLGTFFEKWKIEAIFEDEQGSEFYDKNTLDIVLEKLFQTSGQNIQQEETPAIRELSPLKPRPQPQIQNVQPNMPPNIPLMPNQQMQYNQQYQQPYAPYPNMPMQQPYMPYPQQPYAPYLNMPQNIPNQQMQFNQPSASMNLNKVEEISLKNEEMDIADEELQINDVQTEEILNNISLSDGTPLMDKIKGTSSAQEPKESSQDFIPIEPIPTKPVNSELKDKPGILEGAMEAAGMASETPSASNVSFDDIPEGGDSSDFDDISLLSESLEAQEKFRQYVVSELSKKNVDLTPKGNEFKLDISERTISMIARTMAKKIAKNINAIFAADAKSSTQIETIKQENEKLAKKSKELEEQNRKLRLLLTESNKNLNSYKPSVFGLYKKVKPDK